jgi:hypothetical protein
MERGGGVGEVNGIKGDIIGENEWKHAWSQCRINRTLGNHCTEMAESTVGVTDYVGEGKRAGKKNNFICTCTLDMNGKNHYQQALRHNFW